MRYLTSASLRRIVRLFVPRPWRHLVDGIPGLKITDAAGRPYIALYRRSRSFNFTKMTDINPAAFERLFVIGSGPSIELMNFSKVDLRDSILLNGAVNLISERGPSPFAVVVEDERFVSRHFQLIQSKIRNDTVCFFSVSVIRKIFECDPDWLLDKKVILIDNILKPHNNKRISLEQLAGKKNILFDESVGVGFSECPEEGVFQAGSVVVTAVQFAFYFKPKEISLLGIDIQNANGPRFYETKNNAAFSGIVMARVRICRSLIFARYRCRLGGVELVNYSPISSLRHTSIPYNDQLLKYVQVERKF